MLHNNVILSTSNQNKLNEFKRFGLQFEIQTGLDLPEVNGTIEEVIKYKALHAGEGILVEDSVLKIDGEEVTDIRWRIDELAELKDPEIQWQVSLAILEDNTVTVYTSSIDCALVENAQRVHVPKDAFGFDPYLCPVGSDNKTFYELEKANQKDQFSPRKAVVMKVLKGQFETQYEADKIPEWKGTFQHSTSALPRPISR